jgi:hypothetical protein
MKYLRVLFLSALVALFASCNDDDGGSGGSNDDSNGGTISADLSVFSATGQTNNEWSLPTVAANRFMGRITISATNQTTGETFALLLPDNGVGFYLNESFDPEAGLGTWVPSQGENGWSSLGQPGEDPTFFVEITEIDTAAKTMDGLFTTVVYNTLDSNQLAFFENGVFNDVPYATTIDGGSGLGEGTVTCDIDGTAFVQESIIATGQSFTNLINISATNAADEIISINVPIDTEAGDTYDLSNISQEYFANYTVNLNSFFSALSGNITVTSHDPDANTITGTFEFEAGVILQGVEHSITNGTFDVTYAE